MRDILDGDDPQIAAVVAVIAHIGPDILHLTGVDYDHGNHALTALRHRLADAGLDYPHVFSSRPNTGLQTGRDIDGDVRTNGPRDAQGYGRFAGQGGMAILSRHPIAVEDVIDLSSMLWRDLPGHQLGQDLNADIQRLSTTGHWIVPITGPQGHRIDLMAYHASPPVFDGPDDRNGRRNHDESSLWAQLIDGDLPQWAPRGAFVLLGDANIDPIDGEGRKDAIASLLSHPALQDPAPASFGGSEAAQREGGANAGHRGDPALDTANWSDQPGGPGNLRVDYVLPSQHWTIIDAGVFWPARDAPERALLTNEGIEASRHRLVWVDLVQKR